MGRGGRKNKSKRLRGRSHANGGYDRFRGVSRGQVPYIKPGLPLSNVIKARFNPTFDPTPLTEDKEKDVSKLVWVLFQPYLTAVFDQPFTNYDPSQSQFAVFNLVRCNRVVAMWKLRPRYLDKPGYFYDRHDGARVFVTASAKETLERWSDDDIARRLWKLWALDVHENKYTRWTFIPYSFDQESGRRSITNPSLRQQHIYRALYEAFYPAVGDGKVRSVEDLRRLVRAYVPQARKNLHSMEHTIQAAKPRKCVQQAARMLHDQVLTKMQELFDGGAFHSYESRRKMLGPTFREYEEPSEASEYPESSTSDDTSNRGDY